MEMGSISWTRKTARAHGSPSWLHGQDCSPAQAGFLCHGTHRILPNLPLSPSPHPAEESLTQAFCFLSVTPPLTGATSFQLPLWSWGWGSGFHRASVMPCQGTVPPVALTHSGHWHRPRILDTQPPARALPPPHSSGMSFAFTPLAPNISTPSSDKAGESKALLYSDTAVTPP